MQITQPHIPPAPDSAADVQAVLREMRAVTWGWGLNAVLGWLVSRWIGQVATQIEQLLALFRAGLFRVVPEGVPVGALEKARTDLPAPCQASGIPTHRDRHSQTSLRAQHRHPDDVEPGFRLLDCHAALAMTMQGLALGGVALRRKPGSNRVPSWSRGVRIAVKLLGSSKIGSDGAGEIRLNCSGLQSNKTSLRGAERRGNPVMWRWR